MKKLKLQTSTYKALIINYSEWLDILGFADMSVYSFPIYIQEFFYYVEQQDIYNINHITVTTVKSYYKYLQSRPNERRNGALSKNYLNLHQQALKKFNEYLQKHYAKKLPLHLKPERINRLDELDILTQEEVKALFIATDCSSQYERVRLRDKALLVLLYSCGLRRAEAINVNIGDVLFDKELVLVRKGKNYKERFVPINAYNLSVLEDYVYDARITFYKHQETDALLLSSTGGRLSYTALANSLTRIIKATANDTIVAKSVTPHKLRHAIATHFLEAGMPIEDIKQFLGHCHLETTQIYTHILKHHDV